MVKAPLDLKDDNDPYLYDFGLFPQISQVTGELRKNGKNKFKDSRKNRSKGMCWLVPEKEIRAEI
jgi:hypothetical protein